MTCQYKSIVGQIRCRTNSGGVSDRITVCIAEINSIFVITKIVILCRARPCMIFNS